MNNTYFDSLLNKHVNDSLVIDANLLIVLCTGRFSISLIGQYNKTKAYTYSDFNILEAIASQFNTILTTPNILTEACDLITLKDKKGREFRQFFREFIVSSTEIYVTSSQASYENTFIRLGLADSSIYQLARNGKLVITSDLDLVLSIEQEGLDVINFNKLRTLK